MATPTPRSPRSPSVQATATALANTLIDQQCALREWRRLWVALSNPTMVSATDLWLEACVAEGQPQLERHRYQAIGRGIPQDTAHVAA